jgi:transposase-like protein
MAGNISLSISKIRTDGGTQPRAAIDYAAVDDYMDAMLAGVKFPPITVFYDGTDYWLADGFHRRQAAFGADLEEISCEIHQGTQQDAQWYSFSANKANGLRRSNEDKQRAVKAALQHPSGAGKSDSAIAKHVGVDHVTVKNWRDKLVATCEIHKSESRTGSDGRTINTANIGRKPVEIRQQEPTPARPPRAEPNAPPQSIAPSRAITAPAPPKPEPGIDKGRISVDLLRALFDLAEHKISGMELVASVPQENIPALYQASRTAFEFVGFVFEAAGKRQRGVA